MADKKNYWLGWEGLPFAVYTYHIGDYMHRWIVQTPWGSLRLHHILRSDRDRDMHDHPVDFWTLLLTGGYVEWLPADHPESRVKLLAEPTPGLPAPHAVGHRRQRFSWRYVQAETAHRLQLFEPVWTLLWCWPPRRDWGFHTAEGWVPAKVYLEQYDQAGTTQNAAQVAYDAAQDPTAVDSACSHAWQNFGYATQRCGLCEARRPQPGFECRVCGGIPEHFEPCHMSICNACARSETL